MADSFLPITEVPDNLSEITGRVQFGGERIEDAGNMVKPSQCWDAAV